MAINKDENRQKTDFGKNSPKSVLCPKWCGNDKLKESSAMN
jgi:hypothetical protein